MPVFNNILAGAAGSGGAAGYEIKRSLRFSPADSSYLDRTPSATGDTQKFTLSCWVKHSGGTSDQAIFAGRSASSNTLVRFKSNQLDFVVEGITHKRTSAVYRDTSAWYHIVWAFDSTQSTANTQSRIYINGVEVLEFSVNTAVTQNTNTGVNSQNPQLIGASDTVPNDLFDGYFAEFHLVDGQQLAATDFGRPDNNGVWQPKEYSGTHGTNGFHLDFSDNSSNAALGNDAAGSNNWDVNNLETSYSTYSASSNYTSDASYLLDTTSPFDGTFPNSKINESTGAITNSNSRGVWSNTARSYIRWDAPTPIPITSGVDFYAGTYNDAAEVATLEIYYTDGTSSSGTFTSSSQSYMGRLTGVTSGKSLDYVKVSCANACMTAIRVNGSFLDDSYPYSIDSVIDSPTDYDDGTNIGGNYATYLANASIRSTNGGVATVGSYSNGNLTSTGQTKWSYGLSSIAIPSTGKWYCEMYGKGQTHGGIATFPKTLDQVVRNSTTSNSVDYSSAGVITAFIAGGSNISVQSGLASWNFYATLGVAVNADDGEIKFYVDGTLQHTYSLPAALLARLNAGEMHFMSDVYYTSDSVSVNFGQQGFVQTPPTGYKSLCTQNLDDPTIADGSTVFDVNTYAGNGTSKSIPLSFEPDLIWTKGLNNTEWHVVVDQLRPTSRYLYPNDLNQESNNQSYGVTAFSSTGYTVGSSSYLNQSAYTYVGWAWDAGSSTDTNNTAGTITPTGVRANPSAGFSIVTWTGNNGTVGHGLNAVPGLIISKIRNTSSVWPVQHSYDTSQFLTLDSGDQATSDTTRFGAAPTSSVFSVGSWWNSDSDGVAYCFAPVEGFSAFGSYVGNGDPDGPFVYTGFRPRWLMIKSSSNSGEDWLILDTERDKYNNGDSSALYASQSHGDNSTSAITTDILSNGFKCIGTNAAINATGYTYIYAAFAEHPFKYARAR